MEEVWKPVRVAVIKWGSNAKRHLHAWEESRTLCGRDVPTDWSEVPGGLHYEAIPPRHYGYLGDCSTCILAATDEALTRCATASEWKAA